MGLQYSDSRVIYKVRRTQVTPSLICSGSTADPQILLDQIACACRLEVSGTGIYIEYRNVLWDAWCPIAPL